MRPYVDYFWAIWPLLNIMLYSLAQAHIPESYPPLNLAGVYTYLVAAAVRRDEGNSPISHDVFDGAHQICGGLGKQWVALQRRAGRRRRQGKCRGMETCCCQGNRWHEKEAGAHGKMRTFHPCRSFGELSTLILLAVMCQGE